MDKQKNSNQKNLNEHLRFREKKQNWLFNQKKKEKEKENRAIRNRFTTGIVRDKIWLHHMC